MTTHSSILAWRIPWTEEPGGLQLQRIRQDLVTKQQENNKQHMINNMETILLITCVYVLNVT